MKKLIVKNQSLYFQETSERPPLSTLAAGASVAKRQFILPFKI